ncbi:MAG: glycosyltransferase [Cyanobacteriota bacterium]|nr:glycosyltransferase [Cyanobacteriota bacterium]
MRLLLVHQNFPGQFRDLAPALCDRGHELKAIGSSQRPSDPRIEVLRYGYAKPERSGIHGLTGEVDEWIRRGELVAQAAMALRQRGWAPDVVLAHPGWGEAMLLRQVFPASPLLIWPELWLRPEHLGVGPQQPLSVPQMHYLRVKDWLVDGAMADAAAAVLPTAYQASSFPERWQAKIRLIPEGVPSALLQQPRLASLTISESVTLGPEVPLITFISRNLEPMRGFPEFMRALPALQRQHPALQVVVVGGDEVSYSSAPGDGRSWKQVLFAELEGQLDHSRLHCFGRLPHEQLIKLYRRSNLHVYLSQAFVLSWSLLEIMGCGTPVLAVDNPMLRELISPERSGLLWNPQQQPLHQALSAALNRGPELARLGEAGRELIASRYSQAHCVDLLEQLCAQLAINVF